jgi:DNA-binding XRE family transcriptional regulator
MEHEKKISAASADAPSAMAAAAYEVRAEARDDSAFEDEPYGGRSQMREPEADAHSIKDAALKDVPALKERTAIEQRSPARTEHDSAEHSALPLSQPAKGAAKTKRRPSNLRKFRDERLVSKAELARRANLSVLTIDRVEKGFGCRMATKRKILEALGLTLADRVRVFGEDD